MIVDQSCARKSGFFTTCAKGVFGTFIVLIVCGTTLGLASMYVFSSKVGQVVAAVSSGVPQWREALPRSISEVFDDRRCPEYADDIEIKAEYLPPAREGLSGRVVVTATNKGESLVSLLGVRLTVEDAQRVPVREVSLYAATPFMIDNDWRGPLRARQTRRMVEYVHAGDPERELTASAEITDVRIWERREATTRTSAATTALPELARLTQAQLEREQQLVIAAQAHAADGVAALEAGLARQAAGQAEAAHRAALAEVERQAQSAERRRATPADRRSEAQRLQDPKRAGSPDRDGSYARPDGREARPTRPGDKSAPAQNNEGERNEHEREKPERDSSDARERGGSQPREREIQ